MCFMIYNTENVENDDNVIKYIIISDLILAN